MIKQFFEPSEVKILLNTFNFLVLYYNSEIWLTLFLHTGPKQQLLSPSANGIRSYMNYPNRFFSFQKIHIQIKKSTPEQMALY
jgi:hypothetical protein